MTQSYRTPSAAAGLLQLARLKSGLSQGKLAERAGVPTTMISAYERDQRQPTLPTLLRLLRAAGFDLRMHLAPLDKHDSVLDDLESARTTLDRRHRDRQMLAWREASPVAETTTSSAGHSFDH
jgi:transcriptional regulator with XRE-family HTH domain